MNVLSQFSPVAELAATAALPFAEARAMPRSVYTSEEFLAHEIRGIFAKEWFCVGRVDALANPGDYVTLDLAGHPVMVLRDGNGALRAQSNVCLHRMSTLLHGTGNAKRIVCPYHAWTYNLDGTLRGAPEMQGNAAFNRRDYCLPQIRCEEWLGWVYITLNPAAKPVAKRLAPLARLIKRFRLENYRETFRETHVWDTNWKILAENYMESYHLPICHKGTVGPHTGLDGVNCLEGHPHFNIHWFPKEEGLPLGVAHKTCKRLRGKQRTTSALVSIYPSHMLTLTPGYFWYLCLHPRGVGQVEMIFGGGFAPEFMADPEIDRFAGELRALLADVNIEDQGCTEKVYRGLQSGLARPGHLSHLERPIYDFMRYIAGRVATEASP